MILETDVEYSPGNPRGFLDVQVPDGQGPFPVVCCIHGGGWYCGDKDGMLLYAEYLGEIGIASVRPNYTLSETAPHPAQQNDILTALDWVARNTDTYGFDASRVGLTGASAGGHLSAQVGLLAAKTVKPYTVRAIYAVCPPTDMHAFLRDNPGIREIVEKLVGGKAEERARTMTDASPVSHVHAGAPPCICAHGTADAIVPYSQSVALVDALTAVGVDAELALVEGRGHAVYNTDEDPREPLGGMDRFLGHFRKHLLG